MRTTIVQTGALARRAVVGTLRTPQALVPGLFLCGEILDAFGPIGGHNFAWAWATGRLAGLSATS